jgi:adenylosuccinate synthase
MPCHVVLGAQWGDEGKGKVVDYLAARADVVARFQGGANAGHTLVHAGRRFALHLIPSGVLNPNCDLVLANGMVIDPAALLEEIRDLEALGLDVRSRLRVSQAAHLVLPVHKLQDRLEEAERRSAGIGTTGRGIGPAYADKAARAGLPLALFVLPRPEAAQRLRSWLERKCTWLGALHPGAASEIDVPAMLDTVLACGDELAPLLCDTSAFLHEAVARRRHVLLEGAQGAMLDLDHGTYPYVTSSSCTVAGALQGTGLSPRQVDRVTGIAKAYATRVGSGPFPTELLDGTGERLRQLGGEFGATTGRPRRCGWFDAVAVRHAARLSGFTQLALTKIDVLDAFASIRIADAYEAHGERLAAFPSQPGQFETCRPSYIEFPGWEVETRACTHVRELPAAAQRYLAAIEAEVGVPIRLLSTGPDRAHTIDVQDGLGS